MIRMDEGKVKAIVEWSVHNIVMELRSFLKLENYYRKFIKGYSKIVTPLTDLLKKNKVWDWDTKCRMAFEGLKQAISIELVLWLPNLDLPFEVQTNTSNKALGGVLVHLTSHGI